MSYYRGDYYRGDYYRGDFWSSLGKSVKRVARDVGRTVKAIAPIAGFVLPGIAPLGLLGKGLTIANKVKKIGRGVAMARGAALSQTSVAPAPWATPVLMASQLTGQTVGIPSALPIENPMYANPAPSMAAPYLDAGIPRSSAPRKRRTTKRKRRTTKRAKARARTYYRRRTTTKRRTTKRRR